MQQRSSAGLHVHEAGSGTPVVLVHAFPVDARLYDDQLDSPPEGFRLIAPDLPGFGRSAPAAIATMDDYADAVLAMLDADGINSCVLGGLSMGGYIAFALLQAASRFSALVLADTRAGADSEEAKKGREDAARRAEAEGSAVIIEGLLPRLLAAATVSSRADVVERVKRMGTEASPAGVACALRAMAARPDSSATASAIGVPTLIVVGSEDQLTPVAESEALHAAIKGSRLEVLPGAGHLTSIEAPKEFGSALRGFLGGL
jgi:pimeloyl-ACP methyl ester carboxylesterase